MLERIPVSFEVGDHTVAVVEVGGMMGAPEFCLGYYNTRLRLIRIASELSFAEKVTCFWHELLEYCLDLEGCLAQKWSEERNYLVSHRDTDRVARLLHQAWKTARYADSDKGKRSPRKTNLKKTGKERKKNGYEKK